jgi:hypothetical protein
MDDVEAGYLGQQRDGAEVLDRVVGQLVEDVRVHGQRADVAEHQRVLVVGAGHLGHGDVAGAAGLVLDVDGLAQRLGQLGRDGARDDLAAAARRERHEQADGTAGPGGVREAGQRQAGGGQQQQAAERVGHGGGWQRWTARL